jgi:hypothetical protein
VRDSRSNQWRESVCSPPESGPLLVMLRASCFKTMLIYAPQTNLTCSHEPQQYYGLSFRTGLRQALRSTMSIRLLDPLGHSRTRW